MVRNMMALPPVCFVVDAITGLSMLASAMIALLGPSAAAGLVTGVNELSASSPGMLTVANNVGHGLNEPRSILIVLAVVFSALFALNVAFIRHLRKVQRTVPHTPSPPLAQSTSLHDDERLGPNR